MALYYNLGLCTHTQAEAERCADWFRAKTLIEQGATIPLEAHTYDVGPHWLVGVWPKGMAYAGPERSNYALLEEPARVRIAAVFDGWLRECPPFIAAFFGAEAYDFFLDDGLASQIDADGISGLFIDESLWTRLGAPASAALVAPGRYSWPRRRLV